MLYGAGWVERWTAEQVRRLAPGAAPGAGLAWQVVSHAVFAAGAGVAVGALWTVLKATLVGVVFLWLRVAWPRVREDQLQRFAWLVLLPVALLQLAITAVGVVVLS